MRIVFFGTPQFARIILDYLLNQAVEVVGVVTRTDKPRGRSSQPAYSPVKELALQKKLPLFQPDKASVAEFAAVLKSLHADCFVVAAYAEILKELILEIPKFGCINVHGSILPKYRGAAPVQRAIMAGEVETGVTIMKMALQLDAGDILEIKKTPIPIDMTAGELMEVLANIGKEELWKVLQNIEKGSIQPLKQDSTRASYAKKITTEDAKVQWTLPCETVHNIIRGVTPNPGAWCWIEIKGEKKRLLIKKTLPYPTAGGQPGQIISKAPIELIVGCGLGSIKILELQLEGKKSLSTEIFLRGIALKEMLFL